MPNVTLGIVDVGVRAALAEDRADGLAFLDVSERRGGGVRIDDVNVARRQAGAAD
jgi:hypothetical protein